MWQWLVGLLSKELLNKAIGWVADFFRYLAEKYSKNKEREEQEKKIADAIANERAAESANDQEEAFKRTIDSSRP